jgi:hypothetical protein
LAHSISAEDCIEGAWAMGRSGCFTVRHAVPPQRGHASQKTHATTAIAWTPDRLVIAADSGLSAPQDGRRIRVGTACKIHHEGQSCGEQSRRALRSWRFIPLYTVENRKASETPAYSPLAHRANIREANGMSNHDQPAVE